MSILQLASLLVLLWYWLLPSLLLLLLPMYTGPFVLHDSVFVVLPFDVRCDVALKTAEGQEVQLDVAAEEPQALLVGMAVIVVAVASVG